MSIEDPEKNYFHVIFFLSDPKKDPEIVLNSPFSSLFRKVEVKVVNSGSINCAFKEFKEVKIDTKTTEYLYLKNDDRFYFKSKENINDCEKRIKAYIAFIEEYDFSTLWFPLMNAICEYVLPKYEKFVEKIIEYMMPLKDQQETIIKKLMNINKKYAAETKVLVTANDKKSIVKKLHESQKLKILEDEIINFLTEGIISSSNFKTKITEAKMNTRNITHNNLKKLFLHSPNQFEFEKKKDFPNFIINLNADEEMDFNFISKLSTEENKIKNIDEFEFKVFSRKSINEIFELQTKNNDIKMKKFLKDYCTLLKEFIKKNRNIIIYTSNNSNCSPINQDWSKYIDNVFQKEILYIEKNNDKYVSTVLNFNQLYLPENPAEFAKLFEWKDNQIIIKPPEDIVIKELIDESTLKDNKSFINFLQQYLLYKIDDIKQVLKYEKNYSILYNSMKNKFKEKIKIIVDFFQRFGINNDFIQRNTSDCQLLFQDLLNNKILIEEDNIKSNKIIIESSLKPFEKILLSFLERIIMPKIESLIEYENNVIQQTKMNEFENTKKDFIKKLEELPMPAIMKNIPIGNNFFYANYKKTKFQSNNIQEMEVIDYLYKIFINDLKKMIQDKDSANTYYIQLYYTYLWLHSKTEIFKILIHMIGYSDLNLKSEPKQITPKLKQDFHAYINGSFYCLNELIIEKTLEKMKDITKDTLLQKQKLISINYLRSFALYLQHKTWMFTKIFGKLQYQIFNTKYLQDDKTSLISNNKYLPDHIHVQLQFELYKSSDDKERLNISEKIINNYNYLKHAGKYFEICLRKYFSNDYEDNDTLDPQLNNDNLLNIIDKALNDFKKEMNKIRECLEQILMYYFEGLFLGFLPIKNKRVNVQNTKAIGFLNEAFEYLEKDNKKTQYHSILKLYYISYCKLFLSSYVLVLKDLDNLDNQDNNNLSKYTQYTMINNHLTDKSKDEFKVRPIMRNYMLKTLRKNLNSYYDFQNFSFISNQMMWTSTYIFKENFPSNFDYLFYSDTNSEKYDPEYEKYYETMKQNNDSLISQIFRVSDYDDFVHKLLLEKPDVFFDVTFNYILSNIDKQEYKTRQEYSEFMMWMNYILKNLLIKDQNQITMLKILYSQTTIDNFITQCGNNITKSQLEIILIAFKFAYGFTHNSELFTFLTKELDKLENKPNLINDMYFEIYVYYLNNNNLDTFVMIEDETHAKWKVINGYNYQMFNNLQSNNLMIYKNEDHKKSIKKLFPNIISETNEKLIIDIIKNTIFFDCDIKLKKQQFKHESDISVKFNNFIIFAFRLFYKENNFPNINDLFALWEAFVQSLHSKSIDEPKVFFNFIFDSFKAEIKAVPSSDSDHEIIMSTISNFINHQCNLYKTKRNHCLKAINEKMKYDSLSMKSIIQEHEKDYENFKDNDQPNYLYWKLCFYVEYPNLKDFQRKIEEIYNYPLKYPLISLFLKSFQHVNLKQVNDAIRQCPYYDYIDPRKLLESNEEQKTISYNGYYLDMEELISNYSYRDIYGENGIDYGNSRSIVYQFDLIEEELAIYSYHV